MGQMASNLGNQNVTNPQQAQWGDLDSGEKGSRLLAGGTAGLAKGFQNYQGQKQAIQQRGGGPMIQAQGAQPVDPAYFMPRGNNLAFYGGQ